MTFQIKNHGSIYTVLVSVVVYSFLGLSCSSNNGIKEEQISISSEPETNDADTSQVNSIKGNLSLTQLSSSPNNVILTGMPQHRLVTIYKSTVGVKSTSDRYMGSDGDYDYYDSEREYHFMPGLDLLHGYNLLNIAHYDLVTEQLNHFFEHPVLVKSLYYPSFIQDSLAKKPITRNYYLISVFDADTNADTLINKKDLRRFYSFNADCTEKIQLIPADYSVERSQYDPKNDVMYVFARFDANHDGTVVKKEPLHIFWISLKSPAKAKRMY